MVDIHSHLFILPEEVGIVLLQAVAHPRLPVVGRPIPHSAKHLSLPVDSVANPAKQNSAACLTNIIAALWYLP
jgi:hypothetical protein